MTLILNAKEVEQAINMKIMVDRIEQGVAEEKRGQVIMPPRLNMPTNHNGFFRIMPAVMNDSNLMGFKTFFKDGKVGKVRYMIGIVDQETSDLMAIMDASYLTAVRTGATTGLATRYTARENAKTVGVIGAGTEARTNLEGVLAVRNIEQVKVFSPTPAKRELFATEIMAKHGIYCEAASSPEDAVDGVDIVIVATNTAKAKGSKIAFEGKWIRKGMHINSIGSTIPALREIDADTFDFADAIVVDTKHIETESGDVIEAVQRGKYNPAKVSELKDIVGKNIRTYDTQITLFKSVGTAVQDMMAGLAIYEEAKKLSLGTDVGDFLDLKPIG